MVARRFEAEPAVLRSLHSRLLALQGFGGESARVRAPIHPADPVLVERFGRMPPRAGREPRAAITIEPATAA
jgi:hypothetical protein